MFGPPILPPGGKIYKKNVFFDFFDFLDLASALEVPDMALLIPEVRDFFAFLEQVLFHHNSSFVHRFFTPK